MAEKYVPDEEEQSKKLQDESRDSVNQEVSKLVVVKQPLPLLAKVQQNVDLNQAPPNWLRQSGAGHYFQHSLFSHVPQSSEPHPSSIKLASNYPKVVGEVDVIADAKNVKKLLTLPYSQSNVSMSVHRVGKTLLLDELTLDRSSNLDKLFPEGELPKPSYRKKDPDSTRHRNMYSKLLYYSTQEESVVPMLPPAASPTPTQMLLDPLSSERNTMERAEGEIESAIVERRLIDQVDSFPCDPPDPPQQPFHLNVEWIINDIRMLLGSDLPIFGKEGQPAISLRLRDMKKPITVLTGLDYWLDNLMCNVPELAMCYHLDGIVQKYDVIKTEDIPNLDKDSQFSPPEVLKVAENILSFLKANCTREGHTYWLFRQKGEDLVKLYDLTSLISDEKGTDNIQNPFAKSVAVLFYRVAQRMLSYDRLTNKELASVKLLLENCIKLLHSDPNSQIVISSYYLLADLVLNHTPTTSQKREEEEEEEEEGSDSSDERNDIATHTTGGRDGEISSFSVSRLRHSTQSSLHPPIPPLLINTLTEKGQLAIKYISQAIDSFNPETLSGWLLKGSCQLLQKAGQAYWLMADSAMTGNELGKCLRYSRQAILCLKVALAMTKDSKRLMTSTLFSAWQLSGDVHVLSTKASTSFTSHMEEFSAMSNDDCKVNKFISELYNPSAEEEECLKLHTDIETSLKRGLDCYKFCDGVISGKEGVSLERKNKLKERMGNAWNELGVYYKHLASTYDINEDVKEMEGLWAKSYDCLNTGIDCFKETQNLSNQSLLHANLGSLMKSCASSFSFKKNKTEFTQQEKAYYMRGIEYYMKAKEILKRPTTHIGIWTNIESDLASMYYEMGHSIQEAPPLSRIDDVQEIEREIISLYMKGITHAEANMETLKGEGKGQFVSLSLILGSCHHQLGSLYHKMSFDSSFSAQKLRNSRTQADKHYTKALQSYLVDHHSLQIMRVYLERGLLFEQQANCGVGRQQSFRFLRQSMENLVSAGDILRKFDNRREEVRETLSVDTLNQLMTILIQRFQTVLKQLLSISLKTGENVNKYKEMYSVALKADVTSLSVVVNTVSTIQDLIDH